LRDFVANLGEKDVVDVTVLLESRAEVRLAHLVGDVPDEELSAIGVRARGLRRVHGPGEEQGSIVRSVQ
jgi:hypothetical protein